MAEAAARRNDPDSRQDDWIFARRAGPLLQRSPHRRQAANPGNQRFFGNGHGVNTIAESPPPNRGSRLNLLLCFLAKGDCTWDTPVTLPPVTTVTGASVTRDVLRRRLNALGNLVCYLSLGIHKDLLAEL